MNLYNLDAEMSALGSMLLSERAAEEMIEILDEEDFYRPAHVMLFRAMKRLISNHSAIDPVTLENELKATGCLADCGGAGYILELASITPSASNSGHYAGIVRDKSAIRKLDISAREILGIVQNEDVPSARDKIAAAEKLIFEVGERGLGKGFVPVRDLAKRFFVDVDLVVETGEPLTGTPTGFIDLDRFTSGLYAGNLVIVGARPSMGKTALALNFAMNVAKRKKGAVAIFSLEMSDEQLMHRMASMLSGVNLDCLKTGHVSSVMFKNLADATECIYDLPIFVDDSGDQSAVEMRGKCRRLVADHGLALIVVDYLQLMRGARKTENRVQEVSEIARSLKVMAKELGCPVIALSQLNRGVESRENKRPNLGDLRESGSIEAEADLVLLLYREAYYKAKEEDPNWTDNRVEVAEVIVAKHRSGPTGVVKLGFQPSFTRFANLYRGEEP